MAVVTKSKFVLANCILERAPIDQNFQFFWYLKWRVVLTELYLFQAILGWVFPYSLCR